MRMISHTVGDVPPETTLYQVLRGDMGVSDASVRRAKHVPGGILLDGRPAWVNVPVQAGQVVELVVDSPDLAGSTTDIAPEEASVELLYADDDIAVVDKPAGLVMYPSPGHPDGTLANRLAGWLQRKGRSCGLHAVHRLDRGTSGAVVFAFNSFSKERLQAQLHTDAFVREYLAICEGVPAKARGWVEAPIGVLSRRPNIYGVSPDGKPARTHYEVVGAWRTPQVRHVRASVRASGGAAGEGAPADADASKPTCLVGAPGVQSGGLSLVKLKLETGRTHQIRIHMAHIGCPLLGDGAYGSPSRLISRPALHSRHLALRHPVTGRTLEFDSGLPPDMSQLIGLAGWEIPV